ncbi:MAG: peptidoglycan-binding protein [Acidobacteriaceae bacterium]|nr:peptidoglycan-binding protein [Acidobacteriaceae bacterium]MBV9295952.1 peptidoglycan-binding protein [Acidobacteriaceae bacterium]MBV9765193.1 peptidoglycan-binding protein [Acidobacteriaceae bacterium]
MRGCTGPDVLALQCALAAAGVYSADFNGYFGASTEEAVQSFQSKNGFTVDGVVGPHTATALGLQDLQPVTSLVPSVTVDMVTHMLPGAPVANIEANLPHVLNALAAVGLADRQMILMALATIRAEVGSFLPISECQSCFNTSPSGHPFDLYDTRTDLGNQGASDGSEFRGRGFIQLTGRTNYHVHGQAIGLSDRLLSNPLLAHDPATAANLMASFLKANETEIRAALAANDLAKARRLVNGGSHGLDDFTAAFTTGLQVIPAEIAVVRPGDQNSTTSAPIEQPTPEASA